MWHLEEEEVPAWVKVVGVFDEGYVLRTLDRMRTQPT